MANIDKAVKAKMEEATAEEEAAKQRLAAEEKAAEEKRAAQAKVDEEAQAKARETQRENDAILDQKVIRKSPSPSLNPADYDQADIPAPLNADPLINQREIMKESGPAGSGVDEGLGGKDVELSNEGTTAAATTKAPAKGK